MLDALRFVMGSVAKKDLLPSLSHFVIEDGTVRGYDGSLAMCAPIALSISCKPKADTMAKAIANCGDGAIALTVTANGRLRVKSGKFSVLIDCYPDDVTPHATPEGEPYEIDGEAVYAACKILEPFIGNDAARPWSNGILLDAGNAYATNNVVLANTWTGLSFPHRVCLPAKAVREMVRIKQAPVGLQYTPTAITFHYGNGRWIRTQLIDPTPWPKLDLILDKPAANPPTEVCPEVFAAMAKLKPFAQDLMSVSFIDGKLCTHDTAEEGATEELPASYASVTGMYGLDKLLLLQGVAERIDWTAYPKPALWFGKGIRGAIIGQRKL